MKSVAGRLASVRHSVACATVFVLTVFASGCSPDSPQPFSPIALSTADLATASTATTVVLRTNLAADKCITVQGGSAAKGTPTELQPCAGSAAQQFTLDSNGEIRFATNLCLDDAGGSGHAGDAVIIWTCHGGPNQKWTLTPAGEIRGINDLCVDVSSAQPNDGQPIVVWTCLGALNQAWTIDSTSTTPTTPSQPAPVATVKVVVASASLLVGATTPATATLLDSAGNVLTGRTVTWASSASAVASVSGSGVVTALAAGTANIVATSEGMSGSAALTVSAPVTSTPSGGSCSLVTDLIPRAASAFAKPGYLQAATEPDFRTAVVRVTGDPGTAIGNGISGTWPSVARHEYSKSQPWSADGKLYVVAQMSGAVGPGVQLFLDGDTYQPLFARSHPGPEARWHPTLADVQIYVDANGSVGHWNARTNAKAVRFATSAYAGARMGNYEGNPSADGRYVAVNATRAADGKAVVYVVDVDAGTKSADLDVLAQGFASTSDFDWASVSQGGRFLILHGRINGTSQLSKVYDRATLNLVAFWADHPLGHFDLGIDAAGNEVAFGRPSSGTYNNRIIMRRLDNGVVTPLLPTWSYFAYHASTRNLRRPGWGLISMTNTTGTPLDFEVFWVKLDGSGIVQRLGHHRSTSADYPAQPQAVPSPDGERVAVASNWNSSTGRPVQDYIFDVRSICP